MSLFQYVRSNPAGIVDPYGLGLINRALIWLGLKDKDLKETGIRVCDQTDFVLPSHRPYFISTQRQSLPQDKCETSADLGRKGEAAVNYYYSTTRGNWEYTYLHNVQWEVVCTCCKTSEDAETRYKNYGWVPTRLISEIGLSRDARQWVPVVSPDDPFKEVDKMFDSTAGKVRKITGEVRAEAGMTHSPSDLNDPDYCEGAIKGESLGALEKIANPAQPYIGGAASAMDRQ